MEYAQNTFEGGIVMDYNVGTVPDNILTDALNATMSTFNGNEQLLQNDMGNAKITYRDETTTSSMQSSLMELYLLELRLSGALCIL